MPIAKDHRFSVIEDDGDGLLFVGDEMADEAGYLELSAAVARIEATLEAAGRAGRDVAAAELARLETDWEILAGAITGPLQAGVELTVMDWYSQIGTGEEAFIKEGMGSFVGAFGRALPVRLSTEARKIRWGGRGVSVETSVGTLDAQAAVITVSTGVLGSGALRFDPPLPAWKREAIDHLPMGLLNKIALQFDRDIFESEPGTYLFQLSADRQVADFLLHPFAANLAIGFVGGAQARELEKAGEAAAIAYAGSVLRGLLGADVDKHFVKAHATQWAADPWARGAYSAARPGSAHMRETLSKPVGERLFFAGEACHPNWVTEVTGAYLTGITAAEQIMVAVRG